MVSSVDWPSGVVWCSVDWVAGGEPVAEGTVVWGSGVSTVVCKTMVGYSVVCSVGYTVVSAGGSVVNTGNMGNSVMSGSNMSDVVTGVVRIIWLWVNIVGGGGGKVATETILISVVIIVDH